MNMKRMTVHNPTGEIQCSHSNEEVLKRLAYYEDIHYNTIAMQAMTEQQLRELERNKRQNSAQYKELLGQRLVYTGILKVLNVGADKL